MAERLEERGRTVEAVERGGHAALLHVAEHIRAAREHAVALLCKAKAGACTYSNCILHSHK